MKTKKLIALLVVFSLVFSFFPTGSVTVQAAVMPEFIDVTTDNAPLRAEPSKNSTIIARTDAGRVLKVIGKRINEYNNIWYEVAWENEPGDGKTVYIYRGNVSGHKHHYKDLSVKGVSYRYCDCGSVTVLETVSLKVSNSNALVLGAESVAGATSLADGPLPVGDLIGVIIVAGTFCLTSSGIIPEGLRKITTETDFSEYLRDHGTTCSDNTFRMVTRTNGLLIVIGDQCLSIPEAFVYSRYCKGDVWCPDSSGKTAMECAALNGMFFGPEADKNAPGYYYHYHYGTNHENIVGGHVFYGTGQFTGCLPVGAY